MGALQVLVLLLTLCGTIPALQAAPAKTRKPRRDLIVETGPSEDDYEDAGLAGTSVSYTSIVERGREYYHETHQKRFEGNVLGYITPWNRQGYQIATKFNAKFTHISPVWYQLKRGQQGIFLQGGHEVNQTWIQELRTPAAEGASVPKLVPRVILELEPEHMVVVLEDSSQLVQLLVGECEAQGYDGLVVESWVQWVAINGLNNDHFRSKAFAFIRGLAAALHTARSPKELIVVVPPSMPSHYRAPRFDPLHFNELQSVVDGFSIMTYDFSSADQPGPNSPTHWLQANFDTLIKTGQEQSSGKLMLGINFYGYRYRTDAKKRPEAIVADEVLRVLEKHAPTLTWDERHEEHYFSYKEGKKQFQVFYPTPTSMAARVELARDLGCGLSIWELGQGLERFMDVL